jgi:hypothetical protein
MKKLSLLLTFTLLTSTVTLPLSAAQENKETSKKKIMLILGGLALVATTGIVGVIAYKKGMFSRNIPVTSHELTQSSATSIDLTAYKITPYNNRTHQQKETATVDLLAAVDEDNIDNLIQAIKEGAEISTEINARGYSCKPLLTFAKSPRALNYIVANYPHDKRHILEATGYNYLTPLEYFLDNSNLLMAQALIELGADINATKGTHSALFWSIRRDQHGLLEPLLQKGAILNEKIKDLIKSKKRDQVIPFIDIFSKYLSSNHPSVRQRDPQKVKEWKEFVEKF